MRNKIPSITEVINSTERPDYSKCRLNRNQAIKRHCLDCMGFSPKEVRECPDKKCALWRYRLGKEIEDEFTPPKREMSKEHLEALQKGRQIQPDGTQ